MERETNPLARNYIVDRARSLGQIEALVQTTSTINGFRSSRTSDLTTHNPDVGHLQYLIRIRSIARSPISALS